MKTFDRRAKRERREKRRRLKKQRGCARLHREQVREEITPTATTARGEQETVSLLLALSIIAGTNAVTADEAIGFRILTSEKGITEIVASANSLPDGKGTWRSLEQVLGEVPDNAGTRLIDEFLTMTEPEAPLGKSPINHWLREVANKVPVEILLAASAATGAFSDTDVAQTSSPPGSEVPKPLDPLIQRMGEYIRRDKSGRPAVGESHEPRRPSEL